MTAIGVGAGRLGFLGDAPAYAGPLPRGGQLRGGPQGQALGHGHLLGQDDPELIEKCRLACHTEHNVPDIPGDKNIKWFWGASYEESFPDAHGHYLSEEIEHRQFPLLCNQCETPMCVKVCPPRPPSSARTASS